MNNIWTQFKNELGYVTASIQYTELALRISKKEHGTELEPANIVKTARRFGLSVSEIPEDFGRRIVGSYIIQVHSCVEEFLDHFHKLIGSPTYKLSYDKKDDYLHWTMINALGVHSIHYDVYYRICDYYRLLESAPKHQKHKKTNVFAPNMV